MLVGFIARIFNWSYVMKTLNYVVEFVDWDENSTLTVIQIYQETEVKIQKKFI